MSEKTPPWWNDLNSLPAPPNGGEVLKDLAERALARRAITTDRAMYTGSCSGTVRNLAEVMEAIDAFCPGKFIWGKLQPKEKEASKTFWAWEDGAMEVTTYKSDDEVYIWVMCGQQTLCQKIIDVVANNLVPMREKSQGHVFVIGRSMMGFDFYGLGVASVALERDNYSKDVLTAYDAAVADLNTLSPSGRLTIFDGPPGTGKTFLIRALIDSIKDGIFVFVPPAMVDFLASPELIPMLIQKKSSNYVDGPIIFILEDADNVLVPRDKSNVSLISTLLNMTSGILGSMLDIRAIATTNSPTKDIDPALLRPGRISSHVTVGGLDKMKARQVFKRLTGISADKLDILGTDDISLATVYRDAREHGWQPPKENPKKKRGFHRAESAVISGKGLTEDSVIIPGKDRSWL